MSVNVIEDKVNILCEVKRMTNFEHIQQMSVKKMARLLGCIFVDCDEFTRTIDGKIIFDSFDSIEEWLESEVDNNDLIEVVRCKDCKYKFVEYDDTFTCNIFSNCYGLPYRINLDDFCSRGERRE